MTLALHYHPLSSCCWKVLIALYENDTLFEGKILDLGNSEEAANFKRLWPMAKMPVLVDSGRVIPETSIIIEYLEQNHPGEAPMLPADPDLRLQTRLRDRCYDLYVMQPMQKIVGDRLRPEEKKDSFGVDEARRTLRAAYAMIEATMAPEPWAGGERFGMADCAAAPALFYADKVEPLGDAHRGLATYLERMKERPSFARVLEEAEPYFSLFPG